MVSETEQVSMRTFNNPKAIELYKMAEANEAYVREWEERNRMNRENAYIPDTIMDLLTEAAGLRALADDVEDGIISVDELEGA